MYKDFTEMPVWIAAMEIAVEILICPILYLNLKIILNFTN
jgi:hypothetical protein